MRVPQPDIIEHFGNADAVPQPPERCLSRKAGIVRYCLSWGYAAGQALRLGKLACIQVGVKAAPGQQLLVGAVLNNVAGFHHKDLIGVFDGGKAVRHIKLVRPFISSSKAS